MKTTSAKCANKIHKLILYFNCGCDESTALCNIVSHCVLSYLFSHFFFFSSTKALVCVSLFLSLSAVHSFFMFDAKFCRVLVTNIRAFNAMQLHWVLCMELCNWQSNLKRTLLTLVHLALLIRCADFPCSFHLLWLDSRVFRQQQHSSVWLR